MSRLKITYEKDIVANLISKLSLKNKHEVPKIDRIILNMGLGEAVADKKIIENAVNDISKIAVQNPAMLTLPFPKMLLRLRSSVFPSTLLMLRG